MKLLIYFVEPAKYSLRILEEAFTKTDSVEFYFRKNTSEAALNKSGNVHLPTARFRKSLRAHFLSDVIISNGFMDRFFLTHFFLSLLCFKKVPICIDSDGFYNAAHESQSAIKRTLVKFIFSREFVFGFAAGYKKHREYFTKRGMMADRVYTLPIQSLDYSHACSKDESIFTIAYVGRLIARKRTEDVIEAFKNNFNDGRKCRLLIIGDGPEKQNLLQKSRGSENIRFTGKVDHEEVKKIYSRINVLVLASHAEPWGLVVNEAMSAAIPVIASDEVGAAFDLIENRNTGMIYPVGNVKALGLCMLEYYTNNELYRKHSDNAQTLLQTDWSIDTYRERFLGAIESIRRQMSS
ncbi:MAG: glycosyltransferase family 4 protein [Akkermansiaceae bacterium]|nr:glycosyltransferase family 4 protein [Akkermansiaceae bacterium]